MPQTHDRSGQRRAVARVDDETIVPIADQVRGRAGERRRYAGQPRRLSFEQYEAELVFKAREQQHIGLLVHAGQPVLIDKSEELDVAEPELSGQGEQTRLAGSGAHDRDAEVRLGLTRRRNRAQSLLEPLLPYEPTHHQQMKRPVVYGSSPGDFPQGGQSRRMGRVVDALRRRAQLDEALARLPAVGRKRRGGAHEQLPRDALAEVEAPLAQRVTVAEHDDWGPGHLPVQCGVPGRYRPAAGDYDIRRDGVQAPQDLGAEVVVGSAGIGPLQRRPTNDHMVERELAELPVTSPHTARGGEDHAQVTQPGELAEHRDRVGRDELGDERDAKPRTLRVAYLLNQYPAISHSFILREVQALRRLGVEVHTFSIHRSDPAHLLAAADRREYERTYALRPVSVTALISAHVAALAQRPLAYLKTLFRSLARSRGAPRDLVWQLFYFAEAVPLWRQVRAAGLRHVHSHFTHPASDVAMIVAELGDRSGPWRFSFSAHGADMQETDQQRLAQKVRRAAQVVCVSDFGRSQLMSLVEPEHWQKIAVVHCGLEPEQFATSPLARTEDRKLRVLAVGRLISIKGHEILLEAAALVLQSGVDLELTIVGDGPERDTLERSARRLGIAESVDFPGFVGQDDIGDQYARADVFCLPSLREGVPVVLMEAMASGLPVVASGIMGIPELVEHERVGLLVPPGRVDAIADAIARLACDPESRRALGEAGRAKIDGDYELHSCARLMAAALERASRA